MLRFYSIVGIDVLYEYLKISHKFTSNLNLDLKERYISSASRWFIFSIFWT